VNFQFLIILFSNFLSRGPVGLSNIPFKSSSQAESNDLSLKFAYNLSLNIIGILHFLKIVGITNFELNPFSSANSRISPDATSFLTQFESTESGERKTTSLSDVSIPSPIFSINESPADKHHLSSQTEYPLFVNHEPIASTTSLSLLL